MDSVFYTYMGSAKYAQAFKLLQYENFKRYILFWDTPVHVQDVSKKINPTLACHSALITGNMNVIFVQS